MWSKYNFLQGHKGMSQRVKTDIDLSVCSEEDINAWLQAINTSLEWINCHHVGLDGISSILIISQQDDDTYLISLDAVAAEDGFMTNLDAVHEHEPDYAPACRFTFRDDCENKSGLLNCGQILQEIFDSLNADHIELKEIENSKKNHFQVNSLNFFFRARRFLSIRKTRPIIRVTFNACKLTNTDINFEDFLDTHALSIHIERSEFKRCNFNVDFKSCVVSDSVFRASSIRFKIGATANHLNIDRCNFLETKLSFSRGFFCDLNPISDRKNVEPALIDSFNMKYCQCDSPPIFEDNILIDSIPDIRGTVIDKPIDFESFNFKHKYTQSPRLPNLKRLSVNLLKALAVIICFYPFIPLLLLLSFIAMFCYLFYLTIDLQQHIQALNDFILNRFKPEEGCSAKFHALAEHARVHHLKDAYLLFHAQELRAKRWSQINGHGVLRSLVNWWMDFLSDYGRSVIRPSFGLLLCLFSFAFLYTVETENTCNNHDETSWLSNCWGQAFEYSLNNSFPFLNLDKRVNDDVRTLVERHQQNAGNNQLMTVTAGMQKLISLLFLFLIGLGLRNLFRL